MTTVPTTVKPSSVPMTEERLFELSLPELFAELGVEYVTAPVTDPAFYGQVAVHKSGSIILTMPPNRDDFEHDCVARSLLCTALGLDVDPLPAPFETTVFGSLAEGEK